MAEVKKPVAADAPMSPEAINALIVDLRQQVNDLSMVRARMAGEIADRDKIIRELALQLEAKEVVARAKPKRK